eukprot:gb/GECH01014674.1/.p1 GENE.gb/GECH01014674.1/~~gb/GECH01014674.1/.p1  ORF type:complete len:291 (+),score=75.67 gb/GECH01014674.1/:1-873(+)
MTEEIQQKTNPSNNASELLTEKIIEDYQLTSEEQEAFHEMHRKLLTCENDSKEDESNLISQEIQNDTRFLLTFLVGRKFRPESALETLRNYLKLCKKYEIVPNQRVSMDQVEPAVLTGQMMVLGHDSNGARIIFARPGCHDPRNPDVDLSMGFRFLVLIVQLGLDSPSASREGWTIICDLKSYGWKNMDQEQQKMSHQVFEEAIPVRFRHAYVLNAGWFFSIAFQIVRVFMKRKLRERIELLSSEELLKRIDPLDIPREIGGKLDASPQKWIAKLREEENELNPIHFPSD